MPVTHVPMEGHVLMMWKTLSVSVRLDLVDIIARKRHFASPILVKMVPHVPHTLIKPSLVTVRSSLKEIGVKNVR